MDFKSFVTETFKGGHLYTFVGGGGKSSSMWVIGDYLKAMGYKVRISTTTKIDLKEFDNYNIRFVDGGETLGAAVLEKADGLLLVKGIWEEKGKYFGVEKDWLENISIPLDTIVLVEGDGAKRRPFKLPKSHEPVIPKNTAKVFVLIGALIFNEAIKQENCYNIDSVLSLLEGRKKIFNVENILHLIKEGWLPHESDAPFVFLFNQSDLAGTKSMAAELSHLLWEETRHSGVALSVQKKEVYFRSGPLVSAIVLSAGKSSRMGAVKSLLDYKGKTFLERAIALYGNFCQHIMVPIGHHKKAITQEIKGMDFEFFDTRNYEEGMGGTLREAVSHLKTCDYFFVTLCDLPLVKKKTLYELLNIAYQNDKAIVPTYKGKKGHPVLFPERMRGDFDSLSGESGARKLLTRENTIFVAVEDEGVVMDIDTPEAYGRLGGKND